MKRLFGAVVFLFAASTEAQAQVEGGFPGVYDLSQVTGWIASPDNGSTDIPMWYLASYNGQINNDGTNCNIQADSIEGLDGDYISYMLEVESEEFLAGLRQSGSVFSGIGPITAFSVDGNRGVRFLLRSRFQGSPLTQSFVQHVAGDILVTTTCTAREEVYGAHALAMEWFVEMVRYVNPDAVNNIISQQQTSQPRVRKTGGADEIIALAARALRRGGEASSAFAMHGSN